MRHKRFRAALQRRGYPLLLNSGRISKHPQHVAPHPRKHIRVDESRSRPQGQAVLECLIDAERAVVEFGEQEELLGNGHPKVFREGVTLTPVAHIFALGGRA